MGPSARIRPGRVPRPCGRRGERRQRPADSSATAAASYPRSGGTFYARRFFRILPAALSAAIAHRVLIDYFPEQFGSTRQWLQEIVAFLGGIYNYFSPATNKSELGVYWSLAVEEHFYLILADPLRRTAQHGPAAHRLRRGSRRDRARDPAVRPPGRAHR